MCYVIITGAYDIYCDRMIYFYDASFLIQPDLDPTP